MQGILNLQVTHNLDDFQPDRLPRGRRDGGPVRVLFLSTNVLGWMISSQQLIDFAGQRDDVAAVHVLLQPPRWMRYLNRRIPRVRSHLIHPAATWRWVLHRWLTSRLDASRFDVIHCNAQVVAWAAADLKARLGYKLSIACDTTDRLYDRELATIKVKPRTHSADDEIFAAADLAAPLSTWCAKSLINEYGVSPEKIVMLPPTVAAAAIDSASSTHQRRPLRIAFVGNDFRRKGGPRLLKWHQQRWAERGVELHVASAEAADYPPAKLVTWHGRLDHSRVLELIRTADLLVHPTTSDMSALVVAEAQTLGVPAIASRLAGIPDLLEDGKSGYLIDPADDAGFISAIEGVLFDDTRRAAMGLAARDFARRELDTSVVYSRLFDRIVALAQP